MDTPDRFDVAQRYCAAVRTGTLNDVARSALCELDDLDVLCVELAAITSLAPVSSDALRTLRLTNALYGISKLIREATAAVGDELVPSITWALTRSDSALGTRSVTHRPLLVAAVTNPGVAVTLGPGELAAVVVDLALVAAVMCDRWTGEGVGEPSELLGSARRLTDEAAATWSCEQLAKTRAALDTQWWTHARSRRSR